MDDGEIEPFFERIEVSIPVQERVLFADTEHGDQAVDRLPHRVSANAQRAIVPRGISGHVDAACAKHLELEQLPLDVLRDAARRARPAESLTPPR